MASTGEPDIRKRIEELAKRAHDLRREHTRAALKEWSEDKEGKVPAAFCSGTHANELLTAMGVVSLTPGTISAIAVTRGSAPQFINEADKRGLSPDFCSYSRCFLGMAYLGQGPTGHLRAPDIVITDQSACDAQAMAWEIPSRLYKVPIFRFDGAVRCRELPGKFDKHMLEWRVSELKRLIKFIEEHTQARFDYDKFKEVMVLSTKAHELLKQIQDHRQAIPCPRGFKETASDLFYIAVMPGTQGGVDYFSLVLEEVKERVKNRIGIAAEERYRLFFDGIAVWHAREIFDYLLEKGAVIPFDSYTTCDFSGHMLDGIYCDPEKPFENLALRRIYSTVSTSIEQRLARFERGIKDWHCEGAILFNNRSCRVSSGANFDVARVLRDKFGIPVIEFEGHQADPRGFDGSAIKENLNVFLEALETNKRRRRS